MVHSSRHHIPLGHTPQKSLAGWAYQWLTNSQDMGKSARGSGDAQHILAAFKTLLENIARHGVAPGRFLDRD